MRHHWPIARTAIAALASLILVVLVHRDVLVPATLSLEAAGWLLCGILYTQLFEYWAHRVPMHRGLPYLTHVRLNHLEHHRVFHGESFQTRDVSDLAHIAGRFWVFPLLLLAHYGVLSFVLEPSKLVAFLSGAVIHYLAFELTHWLTHIEDNAIDRAIARVPLLGEARSYQIEHHRIHHETPVLAFNFNPPYWGDRIAGHMPAPTTPWVPVPEAAVIAVIPLSQTTALVAAAPVTHLTRLTQWRHRVLTFGTAAAAGIALVGAIVVARGVWSHTKRDTSTPEQAA